MGIEERVTTALRARTESLPPARTDLSVIRSAAKAQSRRRAAIGVCAVAAVCGLVASGVTAVGRDRADDVSPVAPSSARPTPSERSEASEASVSTKATDATGMGSWTTYTSLLYGFQVGRPLGWTEDPADVRARSGADSIDPLTPTQDTFRSAQGDVAVGVWSEPLDPGTRITSTANIETWVEDYCRTSKNTPCSGIHERAVELCLEKWDCHPGLLVPFKNDVQAFFSGGIYDAEAMTVVGVWRPENDSSVARYGGSRRLLEAFLSTMQVWPASTPRNERE
jgi:hypothetical protein